MRDRLKEALDFLEGSKAEYFDVRFESIDEEEITVENAVVKGYSIEQTQGVGIKVLYDGAWGFSATNRLSKDALLKAAKDALEIAKVSATLKKERVELSSEKPYKDTYRAEVAVDPFSVDRGKKVELLVEATRIMKKVSEIVRAEGELRFRKIKKLFLSSEGAEIDQEIIVSGGAIRAHAVGNGDYQMRSYPAGLEGDSAARGWEFIEEMKLLENAEKTAGEAKDLLYAEVAPSGEYDLVIGGSQMALQIHESCGHPAELDRVMGYEISFAGGSFMTPEKIGTFRYGSPIVNITADATIPGGLGTFGYDDEGVKAQRSFIVKDGILVGYLMSRETAAKLGLVSNGAARAHGWWSIPLIRMTNINLLPGNDSFEELIGGVEEGFYIDTNKSWSIDDKRVNFQFATEVAYEIKNGKLGKLYKNFVYWGKTPEFWAKCDAVGDESLWHVWGVMNCGKGQPMQIMHVGHGTSPARFRKVRVGVKS